MSTPHMMDRFLVEPGFFAGAEEMRRQFEEHAGHPERHGGQHQVWDYWHIPRMYTYMRTSPAKIFAPKLVEQFMDRLRAWSKERLGLSKACYPWLSLYVNGCEQRLHNDAGNGKRGYVLSLTRWEKRSFEGGETLVFTDRPYILNEPAAGVAFYDLVPAIFNQLLVFDDRLPHAVPIIQGSMNPLEGRLVLHGHLSE